MYAISYSTIDERKQQMERIASRIVSRMLLADLISDRETDEYAYEIQVLLEKVVSYVVIFGLAVLFNRLLEIALFTISFSLIRKYSGGIHCRNFVTCISASTLVAFSSVIVFFFINCFYSLYQGVAAMSIMIVVIIGSINNPNIDWSDHEYKRVKQISRLIVVMEAAVLLLLVVLEAPLSVRFFISYGIVMCAMSMLLEIRKKGGVAHEEGGKAALEGS